MDTVTQKKQLGQYLIEKRLITPGQLGTALEEQRKTGLYLRQIFLERGYVEEASILAYFEEELNIPRVDLAGYDVDDVVVKLVPERLARRYRLIPLFTVRGVLTVAMEDPLDETAAAEVAAETGLEIEVCAAARGDVDAALDRWYEAAG